MLQNPTLDLVQVDTHSLVPFILSSDQHCIERSLKVSLHMSLVDENKIPVISDNAVSEKGIVVFSGGSAANSLVDVFNEITQRRASNLSYILPISDNGGSSSELIRVFGGPGIGDIRSKGASGDANLLPPNLSF